MSFNGPALSFDDEGSILFDGEKFIVNNPSKVPDNFNSGRQAGSWTAGRSSGSAAESADFNIRAAAGHLSSFRQA